MPNFNTLRYVNGYYKPGGAAPGAAVVELESANNTVDAYIVKYSSDGEPVWAARIGANANGDAGYGVAIDSSGNVYVTGLMTGKAYIYNANGTLFSTVFPNAGNSDAFLVKYSSSGVAQWAGRIASGLSETGWSVAVDTTGNVFLTGQGGSGAVVTAFNADGTAFGTTLANAGATDIFIVEYNTNGVVQWMARVASTATDIGYAVATDSSGNVYVTGQGGSGVTVTAFNANGTSFGTLANAGGTDAFLVKYNGSGTVQWTARVASTGNEIGFALATDSLGNVFLTGQGGSATVTAFNANGTAFGTTLANTGSGDAFIVEYNTNGVVQWVAKVASTAVDIGYGIATDTSGDVYVVGQGGINVTVSAFSSNGVAFGTTLASIGQQDIFLVKYNSSGIVQWVTRLGTTGIDIGYSVATDSSNNVYITGQSGAAATTTVYNSNGTIFGTLANTTSTTTDAFLVKYNSSGTAQWARKLASVNADIGRSVAVDSTGGIVTTGTYSGVRYSVYGQSLSLSSSFAVSGSSDAFVVKYNANGAPQWTARVVTSGTDFGYGTATDTSGSVYVTGTGGSSLAITAFNSDGTAFGTTIPATVGQAAFVVKYNSSGTVQWVAYVKSPSANDISFSATTDTGGNLIVTGQGGSGAVITAYNSDGTAFGTTLANSGSSDVFVVKYNTSGFVQWVARIATTGADTGFRITTDTSDSIYVTGQGGSGATITAFSSNGVAFGTTLPNSGSSDAFLVKYNSGGTVQWVARIASTAGDAGRGVATDSSGNVYVAGNTGTAITTAFNSDGTAFGTTLPAFASGNCFLVKYNSSGFVQWITRVGAAGGFGVCTDAMGNVFFAGTVSTSAIVFSSNGTTFDTINTLGGTDVWLVKYNTNGIAQWVVQIGSSLNEVVGNLATDSIGNVYFSGSFGGGTSLAIPRFTIYDATGTVFATGVGSYAIAKFDSDGFPKWFQAINRLTSANDVSVTSAGDVYITGQSLSGTFQVFNSDFTPYKVLNSIGGQDTFLVKQSQSGVPQWVALVSSPNTSASGDIGYGVITDSGNNVILCGTSGATSVTTTVYNADGTAFGTTLANSGNGDVILAKYNSSGTVQWATRIGSTATDIGYAVATDSSGNIYVTGQGGSGVVITAFNSDGTAFGTTLANAGGNDAFIVKYNPSGVVQWVARIAGTGNDIGFAIATDSAGNVVVAGQGGNAVVTAFSSNGVAFGTTLANAGAGDAFLVEYDTNGIVQWVARVASTQADVGLGLAVHGPSGQIYITGQAGSGVTTTAFNADTTAFGTTLASLGSNDVFLIAYNSSGAVQWVVRIGGAGADIGQAVTTDSAGNVYVTGQFASTPITFYNANGTTFGTTLTSLGSTDAFLVKYNSSGTVQWVAQMGNTAADIGFAICVDSAGDVYVSGQVQGQFVAYNANGTFFGSVPTLSLTGGGTGTALVKYDTAGVVQWISGSFGGGTHTTRGLAIDSANNLYRTGLFTSSTFVPSTA